MEIAFLLLNVVSGTEIEINEELKKIENVRNILIMIHLAGNGPKTFL